MKGGKRKGSGRKKLPDHLRRVQFSCRLPAHIVEWLRNRKMQGRIVEEALINYYIQKK